MLRITDPTTTELQARADALHERREAAIVEAFALIDKMAVAVTEAVGADGEMNAVLCRLGIAPGYHDARERITKRVFGRLGALRPYIPFETDPDKEQ